MVTFIESGFAALAAWIAGRLADQIGFTQALLWTVPFPWLICGVLYSLFYWAYPRDAAKLRAHMAERAEELSRPRLAHDGTDAEAAVHDKDRARDVIGGRRGQVEGQAGDVVRLAKAAEGHAGQDGVGNLRRLP